MTSEVEQAWEAYVAGDRNAFGKVYLHFHPRLALFCYGLCRDKAHAQNFASVSLLKLLEYDPPKEIRQPGQWLYTVARNQFNGWYRQQQNRQKIEESMFQQTDNVTHMGVISKMDKDSYDQALMSRLTEEEFTIWDLHRSGYSNDEIAEKLSLPYKTVANKKSLIRNQVRAMLKKRI
jgi:RNA polymerase sigma-70 factor (ECF subfamily)